LLYRIFFYLFRKYHIVDFHPCSYLHLNDQTMILYLVYYYNMQMFVLFHLLYFWYRLLFVRYCKNLILFCQHVLYRFFSFIHKYTIFFYFNGMLSGFFYLNVYIDFVIFTWFCLDPIFGSASFALESIHSKSTRSFVLLLFKSNSSTFPFSLFLARLWWSPIQNDINILFNILLFLYFRNGIFSSFIVSFLSFVSSKCIHILIMANAPIKT